MRRWRITPTRVLTEASTVIVWNESCGMALLSNFQIPQGWARLCRSNSGSGAPNMATIAGDLHLAPGIMAVRAAVLAALLRRAVTGRVRAFIRGLDLRFFGSSFAEHFAPRYACKLWLFVRCFLGRSGWMEIVLARTIERTECVAEIEAVGMHDSLG